MLLLFFIFFINNSSLASSTLTSTASATIIKKSVELTSQQEQIIEIPIDNQNIPENLRSKGQADVFCQMQAESGSIVNVQISSIKDSTNTQNEIPIILKNESGNTLNAKLKISDSKLIFDENGGSKLVLKLLILSEIKDLDGTYKANYNLVAQH